MDQKLGELLASVERALEEHIPMGEEPAGAEPAPEPRLPREEEERIEQLFEQAAQDRSKAYELKRELDRLDVFPEYEDRFLDLFKKRES
jgi:hypothetical protein